jgi:hypothetical protein
VRAEQKLIHRKLSSDLTCAFGVVAGASRKHAPPFVKLINMAPWLNCASLSPASALRFTIAYPSSPSSAMGFSACVDQSPSQGLTLVHFSAQLERSGDRGCA